MLKTSHGGAADGISHLQTNKVGVRANNDSVEANLILEAVDVVGSVRVNVLERLGELVVQAVNEGNNGSLNEHGLAVLRDAVLVVVILFGSILTHNVTGVGLQDGQQRVEVLIGAINCQSNY